MSEFFWFLIGIGIVVLVLRLVIIFFQEKSLPYRKQEFLLTPSEKEFFMVLLEAVSGSYHVFAKVRMSDIVFVPKMENKKYYHFFNKIRSKHVDFLLCHKETTEPILAIELDDSSHKRSNRYSRDSLINAIYKNADLPILHIPTTSSYDKEKISIEIQRTLSPKENSKNE